MNTLSINHSTADDLERILSSATVAASVLLQTPLSLRSAGLRAIANALRDNREELVQIADEETSLGPVRLDGEITRTAFQLDLFAQNLEELVRSGTVIDLADGEWPPAPRPDLRRRYIPVGIVAMFSASNFPFAFSVVGGDTASALAAGCPVVVKAHSGHPRLSRRVAELSILALTHAGLPLGTLNLVEGREMGRALVLDPRVEAVAFTGSTGGGRALFDLATSRPRPIPFYGELGSVNPVFVTNKAAAEDGDRIWTELAASFTLGAGQFCTKPGLVFVPREARAPENLASKVNAEQSWNMLDERIATGYATRIQEMTLRDDVEVVIAGTTVGKASTPTVLSTSIEAFLKDPHGLGEESFGPTTLLIEYDDDAQLLEAAEKFEGELTATLQATDGDEVVPGLIRLLETRAGRLLWNQWPTGVAVTGAQQHGGPYPSSTSTRDTSVGLAAIDRFLRPVSYQNFPSKYLPAELQG